MITRYINKSYESFFSFRHQQTDSELACEEAARLTAEIHETDDDDEINYNELPPPPDGVSTHL